MNTNFKNSEYKITKKRIQDLFEKMCREFLNVLDWIMQLEENYSWYFEENEWVRIFEKVSKKIQYKDKIYGKIIVSYTNEKD